MSGPRVMLLGDDTENRQLLALLNRHDVVVVGPADQLAAITPVEDVFNMPHISIDGGETFVQSSVQAYKTAAMGKTMATVLGIGAAFNPMGMPSLPEPKPPRQHTPADDARLAKADAKRARRAERNKLKGL